MDTEIWMILINAAITAVGFFARRVIDRSDALDLELRSQREEIGRLKMINEAQWKHIDAAKSGANSGEK